MPAILVVEDNAITRKLVRFTLEKAGYTVVEATDGKAALEAVERHVPDLVLQDLVLPDVDGFELAGQLRDRLERHRVPILAFSGFVSAPDEGRISSAGFDDLIIKPVEPSRLLQIVQAHLFATDAPAVNRFGDGRALVVADDDPIQAKLAAVRLERLGFEVLIAPDGVQALALARARGPTAIVSDIMMPNADGFQLCIQARRDPSLSQVPVILMTSSYVDEADRRLAEQAGATACVLRTPDLKGVIAALKEALAEPDSTAPPHAERAEVEVERAEVEAGHAERVFRQLERQVRMNAGVSQRCAALAAELSVLSGIAGALARTGNLDASLDEVLSTLFDAGGISAGALLLFEGERVRVRSIGTQALWSDATLEAFFGDMAALRTHLAKGRPVTLPEESGSLRQAERALEAAGLGSAVVAPLVCADRSEQDQIVGALFLTSRQGGIGEEDRIAFVAGASAQIAQGIALARAFAAQAAAVTRAHESEATLRSIMESTADAIAVVDDRGQLAYWNSAAGAIMRLGPDQAAAPPGDWADRYGLFLPDRVTPFPIDQLPLVRAFRGETLRQIEMFVRHAAAPEGIWLSVNAQPLVDAQGQHRGGVAAFRDVTLEKATQEQLMISDRMASVGTLAAGVAHEINNPLASVTVNLQLATEAFAALAEHLRTPLETDPILEELRDAVEGASRIRKIVRDLKIFSHSEKDETGPVDVHDVLDSTLRMAWNELRHRARLVKDYQKVVPVEASESRLGQVFLNLVVNAAQAIAEGRAGNNEIRVATRTREDGFVVVDVGDTGTGMPPEVLARLFTPFFTTKPVGVGTGLGLSICQRIVTGLGGSLTVESEVGKGSVFHVALPPARAVRAQEPPAALAPTLAGRRGKILVVDDEPANVMSVQRALSPEHEVVAVTSADLALKTITSGVRFDVILCDLMMPQMTGMDLHAELLRVDPDQAAKMIFMTGGAFTPGARAFLDRAPNLRIDKPFDAMQLRTVVNDRVR